MEMGYVLFSPISSADPISKAHDGPMLHICRKYKPEIIYLYLSKEMLDIELKEQRFSKALKYLSEKLEFNCKIKKIPKEQLVDVHIFDIFYDEFIKELNNISQKHRDKQILLNVSSGTPAMQAALQTIAALSENNYFPVRVDAFKKGINPQNNFDLEEEWKNNLDNQEPHEKRCHESKRANLLVQFKKNMIFKYLQSYDYHAALIMAKDIRTNLKDNGVKLLRFANCRLQLNQDGMDEALKHIQCDLIPVNSREERPIFEYLLWLQIKQKRGDYADFIRGITPVFVDLLEIILKKRCNISIRNYCKSTDVKGFKQYKKYTLTIDKLNKDETGKNILKILNKKFKVTIQSHN